MTEPGDSVDTSAGMGVEKGLENRADHDQRVEALISELRKRTAELEEANRELRRVSHYRSLFLARMSHELRTPLTSILGFSEILLDQEQLTETQRRFCQKVQDSGFQLQASLNQLVDLSRLEAGQTEVFYQEFSLRETLRESCAAVARMAQKRHVRVEFEIGSDVGTVVSDQGKLRQTIFNFLAWAISRSSEGDAVKISAALDGPTLSIKVIDNGESLKESDHILAHVGASTASDPDINELGVIIGRRLLDLLSGTFTATNLEPRGLEVTIRVPARPLKG
jgi:signal transduction histidine kinase